MNRIRVCHFAASPGLGRGEFYVDLANEQSRRSDLQVALLVPHDALFRDRVHSSVEILEYRGGRSRRNPFFLLELARTLRAWKPHIVHTHFAKPSAAFKSIQHWVQAKWVATKHNPRPGPIFEKVPHVIAVSRGVAGSLRRRDARIIYNAIASLPKPAVSREGRGPVRILSVGRLETVKGYDRLIRSLAAIQLEWRLQLAGDGAQRAELEALAQQLHVADRVEFLGFRSDVAQLLAACDVFIQSSISEGFGVALLEAMHIAPLVISTRVGIAAEIFPDWLIWNPDHPQSLKEILEDRNELAVQFAAWVQPQIARFNMDNVAAEHAAYYREILAK